MTGDTAARSQEDVRPTDDLPSAAPTQTTDADVQNTRMLAMLGHLSLLASVVVGFLSILGPLLVWLLPARKDPFLVAEAKEALNFQITVYILAAVAIVATIMIGILTLGIGLALLVPMLAIAAIFIAVFVIIAGVTAYRGEAYRYPVNFRFVR